MTNVTVIPDDYGGLKKEYLIIRKELDCVNQELYDCKRHLKIAEALQHEYQSEIEMLQSEEISEKQKLEEKIVQLEETVINARLKYNDRIQNLELELSKKEQENENLQAEIELYKKTTVTRTSEDSGLLDELTSLRQENEFLVVNQDEMKLSLETLRRSNLSLEETIMECKVELSDLKENLSSKRNQLCEANDLIQQLNDEILCLKTELETYKSKPLQENSKGNSLFAEVDDRRVYLQKTINNMKADYISIKQERAKHLNMISHLRKENKTLCDRWKSDIEEQEDDQCMVLRAYKNEIQILKKLVEDYKRDLCSKPLIIATGSFDEIEFYQHMLNNKTKELEDLRNQIVSRGLTQTILSTSLKEANKEIRKWKLEATLLQCQLDLKNGEILKDNKVMEKLDEVMKNKPEELKPIMGPNLASRKKEIEMDAILHEESVSKVAIVTSILKKPDKENKPKEVITICDDSSDDVQIVDFTACAKQDITDSESDEEKAYTSTEENLNKCDRNDTDMIYMKEEFISNDEASCSSLQEDKILEEKENVPDSNADLSKVSKKVMFTADTISPKLTNLKRNCKRVVVPKPVYVPSE